MTDSQTRIPIRFLRSNSVRHSAFFVGRFHLLTYTTDQKWRGSGTTRPYTGTQTRAGRGAGGQHILSCMDCSRWSVCGIIRLGTTVVRHCTKTQTTNKQATVSIATSMKCEFQHVLIMNNIKYNKNNMNAIKSIPCLQPTAVTITRQLHNYSCY